MFKDTIKFNGKEYQLSTVNLGGCYETMVFPIEDGRISGKEVCMCSVYTSYGSQEVHKDILFHPEKYLTDEAIAEYLREKEEDIYSTSIWIVYGHIDEHGDTDTWVEELFDNEVQAKACCEFLNMTKNQKNVEYSISENAGFNNEDWVAKLKYLSMEAIVHD